MTQLQTQATFPDMKTNNWKSRNKGPECRERRTIKNRDLAFNPNEKLELCALWEFRIAVGQ